MELFEKACDDFGCDFGFDGFDAGFVQDGGNINVMFALFCAASTREALVGEGAYFLVEGEFSFADSIECLHDAPRRMTAVAVVDKDWARGLTQAWAGTADFKFFGEFFQHEGSVSRFIKKFDKVLLELQLCVYV